MLDEQVVSDGLNAKMNGRDFEIPWLKKNRVLLFLTLKGFLSFKANLYKWANLAQFNKEIE